MSKLLIEQQGSMTLFTLNRPAVHNNVDHELAMELADAILAFGADEAAKVLVVTGAGDRTFCAGANLKGDVPGHFESARGHGARRHDFLHEADPQRVVGCSHTGQKPCRPCAFP